MNTGKEKPASLPWNHAWLIPYLTALLYFATYIYQSAYNNYYGLPTYLIDIDVAKITQTILPMGFFLVTFVLLLDFLGWPFKLDARKYEDRQRIVLLMLILFTYIASLIGVLKFTHGYMGAILISATSLLALVVFILTGMKKVGAGMIRKQSGDLADARGYANLSDYLSEKSPAYTAIVALTLVICIFSYSFGTLYPSFQNGYLALRSDPKFLVINTYKGNYIFAQLTAGSSSKLDGEYRTVDIASADLQRIHTKVQEVKRFTN